MNGRRVLLVAPEAYPLAKTGGLGDFVAGLAKALTRAGCDVRLLVPGYPEALARLTGRVEGCPLGIIPPLGEARLVQGELPGAPVPVSLIDCPDLYRRPGGPYQDDDGADWPDNARRFALLARVGAQLASTGRPLRWRPQIVHLNDWQSGPLAAILAQERSPRPPCVFTIHNMAFQGLFGAEALDALGLPPPLSTADGLEFWGHVSFLKAGIRYADRVTTVSETYAREILTPAFGCGLDGVLAARPDGVLGIRNGIDDDEWDPATDPHLPAAYHRHDLRGKAVCKTAVQAQFGLEADSEAPMLAYLSRLTEQKMADIVPAALPALVERGVQVAVMGRGDRAIESAIRAAADRFAGRIGVYGGYEEAGAHRLIAGADMLLAPARFEPCGLTQMYAMRYGTVPIGSRVGGLAETIIDLQPAANGVGWSTGFLFDGGSASDLLAAVDRALDCFQHPFVWRRLIANGMHSDFSWSRSAQLYLDLYEALTGTPAERGLDRALRARVAHPARSNTAAWLQAAARSRWSAGPNVGLTGGTGGAGLGRPEDRRHEISDFTVDDR